MTQTTQLQISFSSNQSFKPAIEAAKEIAEKIGYFHTFCIDNYEKLDQLSYAIEANDRAFDHWCTIEYEKYEDEKLHPEGPYPEYGILFCFVTLEDATFAKLLL